MTRYAGCYLDEAPTAICCGRSREQNSTQAVYAWGPRPHRTSQMPGKPRKVYEVKVTLNLDRLALYVLIALKLIRIL